MKTEKEIQAEIIRITKNIGDSLATGVGYDSFSQFRQDKSYLKALEWVLGSRKTLVNRK